MVDWCIGWNSGLNSEDVDGRAKDLIAVSELSKEAEGIPGGEWMGDRTKLRMGGSLGKVVSERFQVPQALNWFPFVHLEPHLPMKSELLGGRCPSRLNSRSSRTSWYGEKNCLCGFHVLRRGEMFAEKTELWFVNSNRNFRFESD